MAFTPEDATGVVGANSYLTVEAFRTFCDDRAVTLDESDPVVASQLVKAADWLETMADKYIGLPTFPPTDDPAFAGQGLAWPRTVTDCCTSVSTDLGVPERVKKAQAFAAIAIASGVELMPTLSQGVKRQKVDVLEVEFFGPATPPKVIAAIEQIQPLLIGYRRPGQVMHPVVRV